MVFGLVTIRISAAASLQCTCQFNLRMNVQRKYSMSANTVEVVSHKDTQCDNAACQQNVNMRNAVR